MPTVQMRHPACRRALFRCSAAQSLSDSLCNLRHVLRKPCGLAFQLGSTLRRLINPPSLPCASNRINAVHDCHSTASSDIRRQRERGQPWLTAHHPVPGSPPQLPAGGIQSPYVHRASGLLQIAVSTPLRKSSSGNRKSRNAEHCRYGTRDFGVD